MPYFGTSGGGTACKRGVCMRCCAPGPLRRSAARVPGCESVRRPCRHGAACVPFPPYRAPSPQRNAQSCTEAGQHGNVPVRAVCRAVSAVRDTVLCDVHLVYGAVRTLVTDRKGRQLRARAMIPGICGLYHASAMSSHCERPNDARTTCCFR